METTCTLEMGTGRGQWWPYQLHDGRRSAVLRCPKCGMPSFVTDHKISGSGHMHGAFVCRGVTCEWSGRLTLEGWREEEAAPVAAP